MFKRKKTQKRIFFESNWGKIKDDYFDFDKIEAYFINKKHSNSSQLIQDKVLNDIDFYKLFEFADRTSSKVGQQYLYDKLLSNNVSKSFEGQEKMIDFFLKNKTERIESQVILSELNEKEALLLPNLIFEEYIQPSKWFSLLKILPFVSLLLLIITFFIPKFLILLVLIFGVNLFFHYTNKGNIIAYAESVKQLTILSKVSKKLLKLSIPIQSKREINSALLSIKKLKKLMFIFSIDSQVTSEIAAVFLLLVEYVKIFFLVEPLVLFRLLRKLKELDKEIHTLFSFVGNIDTNISIASLRTALPYFSKPQFVENDGVLEFEDIFHPLIENCVPNSLNNNGKSVLLTGSNMAGKTTFIRSLTISILFGQTINTCFAKSFHCSQFKLFSAIRISDDLLNDKSYFFEEVSVIKDFVLESEKSTNNIFLLDELFKGTNTLERIATGKSVLSFLNKGRNLVFVSTHDLELTDLLANEYELYHFTETVDNGTLDFDYKLKSGGLKTRNAIRILEISGFPEEILLEAKSLT